jgi:lipopolysaccharide transport protein LptA
MTPLRQNKHKSTRVFLSLCIAAFAAATTAAWSLSADREQELIYSADGNSTIATVEGMRVVTVRENVFIKQGSMELRGDLAIFEYDQQNSELRKVSVTGRPASFQQEPDGGGEVITGSSEHIYYYVGSDTRVEFVGTARFNQGGSVMNCVEIRHGIDSGTTEMTGPCRGTLAPQSN